MTLLQKLAHWWRGKRPLPQIDPSVGEYHVINYTQATRYKSLHTANSTLACAPGLCQGRATCADQQCPGHPGRPLA